jgi:hypothetical protein
MIERDVLEDVKEILYRAESGTIGVPVQPMMPTAGSVEDRVVILEQRGEAMRDAILLLAKKLDETRDQRAE